MSDTLQDPRPRPLDDAVTLDQVEDARPAVAATRARGGMWLTVGGAAALGLLAFVWLSANRDHKAEEKALPTSASIGAGASVASAPPPADLALEEASARGGPPAVMVPAPVPAFVPPVAAPPAPPPQPANAEENSEISRASHAPALVVDFSGGEPGAVPAPPPTAPGVVGGVNGAAPRPAQPGGAGQNANEQFAARVSGQEPEHAEAIQLHHRSTLIAQGATITGVLETALNSDLPGYARAVVSRDVRGFDGSEVLIPRGSRVIGEYKSAVAQGQSRAFVIWTRIIRPDGASIQIASSGTDPLGRAGLAGKVNTHFFQRFSGAILLSVIDAGVSNLANRNNSTQVIIGSSTDAATASLSGLLPTAIPPTIKVAQGAPIRIFVARDLDFSTVQRSER